jgi:hypothetical protein
MSGRLLFTALLLSSTIALGSCGSTTPESPTAPTPAPAPAPAPAPEPTPPPADGPLKWPEGQSPETAILNFTGAAQDGGPYVSNVESRYTIAAAEGNWTYTASAGFPAPSIYFESAPGTAGSAEIRISGAPFKFSYLHISTSAAPVSFVITGTDRGRTRYTQTGTVAAASQGAFRQIFANANEVVDGLTIRFTSEAAPAANRVGFDHIAFRY